MSVRLATHGSEAAVFGGGKTHLIAAMSGRSAFRESPSGRLGFMYPCPCCGYKTLPDTGGYDLCPVCWWEDDGVEPWEYSGPNAQTLVEAQQEYLAEHRPYRLRSGKVRPPKRKEARDPDWRPFALTDELLERVERTNEENQRFWEEEQRRVAQEIADDPEGPFKNCNAAIVSLRAEAQTLSHRELTAKLRELSRAHELTFSNAHLELLSRQMKDEGFYRHHPIHAVCWLLRYSRPGTLRRRWAEVRTGTIRFAG